MSLVEWSCGSYMKSVPYGTNIEHALQWEIWRFNPLQLAAVRDGICAAIPPTD